MARDHRADCILSSSRLLARVCWETSVPSRGLKGIFRLRARTLGDYYRCLDRHASFEQLESPRSHEGFFRFGRDAVGFGLVADTKVAPIHAHDLIDLKPLSRSDSGGHVLPFDPDAVVDNLRHERYPTSRKGSATRLAVVRNAYYAVRPLLPVGIRKHLQRLALGKWQDRAFPRWPVDCSVDNMQEALLGISIEASGEREVPFIWFWPHGRSACAVVTHDVETAAGLAFCPSLMDLDEAHGIHASFQIIPEGRYKATSRELDNIRQRGFEVNVHDWNHDGLLYSTRDLFLSRVQLINRAAEQVGAEGFRSGVMYRNAEWYDELKFAYDMSIPNVAHLDPQPGGCCTVMPYFIGNILEIPLTTIQDYSLFNILSDYSINIWAQQSALIRSKHGLISINVHPDYLVERRAQAVYKQMLAHLAHLGSQEHVWLALPGELNRWWRERHQMHLVERDGRVEITGPGKERARIAWASIDGDQLAYRFA